jgi:hypothetical protein
MVNCCSNTDMAVGGFPVSRIVVADDTTLVLAVSHIRPASFPTGFMHLRFAVLRCAVVVPSGLHQLAVDPASRLLPQDALNPFRFSSTEASHGQVNGNGSHLASGRDGVSQQ